MRYTIIISSEEGIMEVLRSSKIPSLEYARVILEENTIFEHFTSQMVSLDPIFGISMYTFEDQESVKWTMQIMDNHIIKKV